MTLFCLNDLFATVAQIIKSDVPKKSCEDSVSFLPQLLGKENPKGRSTVIHHSVSGHFAIRDKSWKLILARGSGGWSSPNEKQATGSPKAQLYNFANDISEQSNLYLEQPQIAKRLLNRLENDINAGRTTAGPDSRNDITQIILWKSGS